MIIYFSSYQAVLSHQWQKLLIRKTACIERSPLIQHQSLPEQICIITYDAERFSDRILCVLEFIKIIF